MSGNPPITPEDVVKVAHLARLRLTDDEVDRFARQLGDILGHAEDLDRLDLSGVEPMAHPIALRNVFREDVVGPLLDRDEVMASAPAVEDSQFRVPPVLGEEG